jgi:hypothetical protein
VDVLASAQPCLSHAAVIQRVSSNKLAAPAQIPDFKRARFA